MRFGMDHPLLNDGLVLLVFLSHQDIALLRVLMLYPYPAGPSRACPALLCVSPSMNYYLIRVKRSAFVRVCRCHFDRDNLGSSAMVAVSRSHHPKSMLMSPGLYLETQMPEELSGSS